MGLIRALLPLAPPVLFVVLDRIQLTDDPATATTTTARHLVELLGLLREHGAVEGHAVKLVATTAGSSRLLARCMRPGELVDAQRMLQARPGQPRKGWSGTSGAGLRRDKAGN
jgi:hypothetical protein